MHMSKKNTIIDNTAFLFHRKSRMCWEYNNVFHYRSQRKYLGILTRDFESLVNVSYEFYLVSYFGINVK